MTAVAARREVVRQLQERSLSERQALRLVGMSASTLRYQPRDDGNGRLRERLTELAGQHRRHGYRMLHSRLRIDGWAINVKRTYRVYREEGLMVRKRRRKKLLVPERQPLVRPMQPDEVWSMDFVFDELASGRRVKTLTEAHLHLGDAAREPGEVAHLEGAVNLLGEHALQALAQFRQGWAVIGAVAAPLELAGEDLGRLALGRVLLAHARDEGGRRVVAVVEEPGAGGSGSHGVQSLRRGVIVHVRCGTCARRDSRDRRCRRTRRSRRGCPRCSASAPGSTRGTG